MPQRCCVVGCSNDSDRFKSLAFLKIARKDNPDWQQQLVRAVNRSDPSFSVKNAVICSAHFRDDCFWTRRQSGASSSSCGEFYTNLVEIFCFIEILLSYHH